MRDLIATQPFTYATRRLKAGDYFTAQTSRDARVLLALRKVKIATEKPSTATEPEAVEGAEIQTLRANYERMFGKRPFMGWDAEKLREKLSELSQD